MAGWGWLCRLCWLCWLCWLALAGQCTALVGSRLFDAPASYDVDSTVLLNDVTRQDKEVGYKIRATLDVVPVWADAPTDFLLKFHLHSPKLHLRGKHVNAAFLPHDSVWDSYGDTIFYAHWSRGLIKAAYLDPDELPDVLNYKKSLLSLFQFQGLDGEHNETDVSGPCSVIYETISTNVIRKIKRHCAEDGAGVVSAARRVARYSLSAARGALDALLADELLALGPPALGLKARAWTALARRAGAPPAPPAAAPPARAPAPPGPLRALPLALAPLEDEPAAAQELEEALRESRSALEAEEGAGGGGGADVARAALRLLPPLQAANSTALLQLLQRPEALPALPALCRLLGLAGTRASHAAASDFLQLGARDPLLELAHSYLAAFALADEPDEGAVLELLRLGDEGRSPVAEAALLAAAAAAAGREPLAQRVRDALARGLARCREARCRAGRLRALANLRRADSADLLLEHARRGGGAALAALDALAALPPRALTFARLERLTALALDARAPLEQRAAALDLLVQRRAPLPAPLAPLAHELHARGPPELRRLLWQRVAATPALAALPRQLGPLLRGWDAQAHAGTSSVLRRDTGWAAAGWRAQLESVQVAQAGLLRRGTVRLLATDLHNNTFDALSVEVWTRGLEAFSGGSDADGDAPAESAAGGLAFTVGGVRMREVSLFDGQAELLAHVWAGTGSAATPVLRALRPLAAARGAVPLLAGVRLRAGWRAALALALDAQAQASLWRRSARAALELRAGAAGEARAALRTAWAAAAARAQAHAAPRLRLAADLDFYGDVALCVRARTERHEAARAVSLQARGGARRLRVRRRRAAAAPAPGRTLALGRPNDVTCRTLLSADADEAEADEAEADEA